MDRGRVFPGVQRETSQQTPDSGLGASAPLMRAERPPGTRPCAREGAAPARVVELEEAGALGRSFPSPEVRAGLPDKLCVVVGLARQQLHLPPVQKLVQAGEGVLADGALVDVTPHLHAHQHDADVQRPVKLMGTDTRWEPREWDPEAQSRADLHALNLTDRVRTTPRAPRFPGTSS